MSAILRSSARPWLPLAGCVLALVITIGAALSISQGRLRELSKAGREMGNLAIALAVQTDQAFQAVELVQSSLIERFDAAGRQERPAFDAQVSTEEVSHALGEGIAGLPQVDALTLVDADGDILNSSRHWPAPAVNVADRDYFKALVADPKLTSYISAPAESRATGNWTIYLARKITGRDGAFLGLVLGAVRLEHFERMYGAMSLGPRSAVSLLRRDGTLLARYPRLDPMIGRSILANSPAMREAVERSSSTVRQVSPIDGRDRVVSARASARYPLTVVVGEEVESILAEWRGAADQFALAVFCIDLLIAVAVFLGMRQISEQRRIASMAHRAARHDPLTELPNRFLVREALADRLGGPGRFSLMCIDLDRFKAVNDGFGHPVGDDVLKGVAARLQDCVRPGDIVARTGGDEFTVIHGLLTTEDDGTDIAERILRVLGEPFSLDVGATRIGASIGVAVGPDDGGNAADLMRNADLALYTAKAEGRERWRRYEPAMATRLRTGRALEQDLARSVAQGELALHYQPIVDLETNRTTGFEALLRWNHPQRGLVSPAEFIPIAEATGLIVPIGEWVIQEALREASTWPDGYTVAVNVAAAQLASGRTVDCVAKALLASGLDPRRLELEITETALLDDDDAVLGALHRLRALGVRIALDDFGVGYSSLSYVTSFPFDRIKIDRSFVQKMKASEASFSVVDTILHLANRLGVKTTGEGVETPEHLEALREVGCTEVQGYYLGKPKPASEIRRSFGAPALRLVDAA